MMRIKNLWPFKKDDHAHFEALVSPYLKQLYKLAYRLTRQRDDAEDLVQDLLLKLYPRLDEMRTVDNLAPWLSRILYRMFIDQFRNQSRSPIDYMGDEDVIYDLHESQIAGPSENVNTELTMELINTALEKLSDDHRMVIMLHDIEGYSLQEINEMIDLPIGTIKSRLSRARNNLRENIQKMDPTFVENVNSSMRL